MSKKGKYLVVDTETTGLSFAENGLIQLAAAVLDEELEVLDTFCQDVCTPKGYLIGAGSLEINGFTVERIEKGGGYEKVCGEFLVFLNKNFKTAPVSVGQFFPFDYAFLHMAFAKVGLEKELGAALGNDFIDTKVIVNTLNLKANLARQPLPFPSTSLSKPGGLKDKLSIDLSKFQAHDALGDVLATREVLVRLLKLM